MPAETATVRLAAPPAPAVLKAMTFVARPIFGSRLGGRVRGVMLLDFQGRRTGRAMSVPVNFNLVDDVPMAFTSAPWRHSFTGGIPVMVTHLGRSTRRPGPSLR